LLKRARDCGQQRRNCALALGLVKAKLLTDSADADTGIDFHVVSEMTNLREHCGAVADEGGAFDGLSDFSVFDFVGFGALEDEFAAGDIDLAAAKICCVNAVFQVSHDFFGVFITA